MLRLIVLALIVANLGFYAWTQGLLDGVVGARAQGDREPDRLQRQVRPETIRVLPPSATAVAAVVEQPPACLEAGPYTPAQIAAAEGVLQTVLPSGSWTTTRTETAAVWVVYMGKYPNRDALLKKADELKRLKIAFEEVHGINPELDEGLALGRYDSKAAAEKALADVTQRGVRTARVAALSPAVVTHNLHVERADATLQSRLAGLRAEALLGKAFTPCPSVRQ
ncbi:MAG TPA: SPOR domain-containing protein [Rhizobacter sp.]|nr:SPOR domain-containing protein [Rhizobacter sp.]